MASPTSLVKEDQLDHPYSTLLAILGPIFGKGPDNDNDNEVHTFAMPIYSQESHKWPLKKFGPFNAHGPISVPAVIATLVGNYPWRF